MTIKTIRLNKSREVSPEKEREVKITIILLALFAGAMIIGAGVARSESVLLSDFKEIFDYYISKRANQSVLSSFVNSIVVNIAIIGFVFISGFNCIGLPASAISPVIKGLGMGLLAGYLFAEYAITGIGYYLLTILPGSIISISALILACNNSFILSLDILALVLGKKTVESNIIKNYIYKFAIIVIIIVAASVTDAILIKAFAYMFIL